MSSEGECRIMVDVNIFLFLSWVFTHRHKWELEHGITEERGGERE